MSKKMSESERAQWREYYSELRKEYYNMRRIGQRDAEVVIEATKLKEKYDKYSFNNYLYLVMQARTNANVTEFTGEVLSARKWKEFGNEVVNTDAVMFVLGPNRKGPGFSFNRVYDLSATKMYQDDQAQDQECEEHINELSTDDLELLPKGCEALTHAAIKEQEMSDPLYEEDIEVLF